MTIFAWHKLTTGSYVVTAAGDELPTCILVHPDDTLAAQYARCCANALNTLEREKREAHNDAVREQREAQEDARNEAMADKWDHNADHDCLPERYDP